MSTLLSHKISSDADLKCYFTKIGKQEQLTEWTVIKVQFHEINPAFSSMGSSYELSSCFYILKCLKNDS